MCHQAANASRVDFLTGSTGFSNETQRPREFGKFYNRS
jgi:hypothetical protein